MDDKLYNHLLTLPRKNLIHLMWDVLDEMQTCNDRTKIHCIMLAIGATEHENPNTGCISYYTLPSRALTLKNTENMGL